MISCTCSERQTWSLRSWSTRAISPLSRQTVSTKPPVRPGVFGCADPGRGTGREDEHSAPIFGGTVRVVYPSGLGSTCRSCSTDPVDQLLGNDGWADSSGGRDKSVESFRWSLPCEGLAWTLVEQGGDRIEVLLGVDR